jgi:protein-L-isoaspartate(D-aspartate) O-methyltransferase
MQQLDEQARPYAEKLVAVLKQEGTLSQPQVEAAFLQVPRHLFLDRFFRREIRDRKMQVEEVRPSSFPTASLWLGAVYANEPLATAYDEECTATSSSSSPAAMAVMLEASELGKGMRVLEIGTGTGYNAALLTSIVGSTQRVFTVEIDADLAAQAQLRLNQVVGLGVTVHSGNGLEGYAPGAPYDRILVTGSTSKVPFPWLEQIRPGGIILMNLIGEMGACAFLKIVKKDGGLAAHGRFLSGSEFMELHEAGKYPHRRATLVGQYLPRPITQEQSATRAEFDLSLLWDRRLDFALQLAFPQMSFASVYVNPMCPCLIDRASDTMLLFRPSREEHFQVEVRGDPHLWEQVAAVYHQWVGLGQPDVGAYHLHIDAGGKQVVTLAPSPGRKSIPSWVLSASEEMSGQNFRF